MFAAYLMFNGFERFWIEKIRVNTTFDLLGITMTQAELISVCTMLAGVVLWGGHHATLNRKLQSPESGLKVRQYH